MDFINDIIQKLGIPNVFASTIIIEMRKLNNKAKLKIINHEGLNLSIDALKEADDNLGKLIDNGPLTEYYKGEYNQKLWNNTMTEVARLQGLILLRKISETNCDGVIQALLGAFDAKLKAVNNILASDLTKSPTQIGGSNDAMFKSKYEKYKMKYLNLKNKNNM
jgi:hypothetical protein